MIANYGGFGKKRCQFRYETWEEYRDRVDAYMKDPVFLERIRNMEPTHTYSRKTGKITKIDKSRQKE